MSTTLLPAIRSKVGDWVMYVTSMTFNQVNTLLKSPDEVHERKELSDWIQREAIDVHAEEISNYIRNNQQRFLGSLIVGVYDGNPNWAPLNISIKNDHLDVTELQAESIEGKLGLLHLSGEEKLFAIDGQHRVAGIKKALEVTKDSNPLNSDEVSAIFVAHDESTVEGKKRTRRLFTTVNKKARRISKAATIALDEDNGFAIVTRMLIDSHWLFEDKRKHISYTSTGSISAKDETSITSVVGLYEIVKDLFVEKKRNEFESVRPSDKDISRYLEYVSNYLNEILEKCSQLNEVFVKNKQSANYYREEKNHMLFRPIGQRAFARATQLLVQRGLSLEETVSSLLEADLDISSKKWHNILWDPVSETMITNKLVLAETNLLHLVGHDARTKNNQKNLDDLLEARG